MSASLHTTEAAPAPRMGATEYGLMALQSMLWGSTFFFIAVAGNALPIMSTNALRLVFGIGIMLAIAVWYRLRLPATPGEWLRIAFFAAINSVIPFSMIAIAQREVPGGISAVFNATAPLFAVLAAPLLIAEERFSWLRVAGIVTGIAGVAILIGVDPAAQTSSLGARALLLGAAACYAGASIFGRLHLNGYDPFALAAAQMLASLVMAGALALALDAPWQLPMPGAMALAAIAAMGILGSALSSLCHFTVLKRAGATNALLVTIVLPLTPIVLGGVFLGERLTARDAAGALVIAAALVLIDGRLPQRLWRHAVPGRAFSGKVDSGLREKMRQTRELERFPRTKSCRKRSSDIAGNGPPRP